YHWTLIQLFRRPVLGVLIGVGLPLFGFYQAKKLPEQFFPPADRDQIHIELELPASTSLAETKATAEAVREVVLTHGQVARVHWFLGESAPTFFYNLLPRRKNSSFYAQALVELTSPKGSQDTIRALQDQLDVEFPQCRLLVRQLEQGPPFDAPVEVRLFG